MDNDSILVLRKFKLILTRSLSLFWLVPQSSSGKGNIFILTVRHTKFQCELWLPSWYFLANFNIVSINRMGFSLISWNPGRIQLKFSSSLIQKHIPAVRHTWNFNSLTTVCSSAQNTLFPSWWIARIWSQKTHFFTEQVVCF